MAFKEKEPGEEEFKQEQLAEEPTLPLPITPVSDGAVLDVGLFKSPNYVKKRRGWALGSDGSVDLIGVSKVQQFQSNISSGFTTVDGLVARSSVPEETWATIIAGAGNFNRVGGFTGGLEYAFSFTKGASAGKFTDMGRMILTFDTSFLSGAVVVSATLSVYGNAKTDPVGDLPNLNVYGATPATNNNLVNADYGQTLAVAFSTPITYNNFSVTGYNNFALNDAGLLSINKTGITKFSLRNANYDVAAVTPVGQTGNATQITIVTADFGSNQPILSILYYYL